MNANEHSRARRLSIELYGLLGYGFVSRTASEIGLSRGHVSRVLNGQEENDATLDKIDALIESIRASEVIADAA